MFSNSSLILNALTLKGKGIYGAAFLVGIEEKSSTVGKLQAV